MYRVEKWCTVPVLGSAVPVSKLHGFKRKVDWQKDLVFFHNISYVGEILMPFT